MRVEAGIAPADERAVRVAKEADLPFAEGRADHVHVAGDAFAVHVVDERAGAPAAAVPELLVHRAHALELAGALRAGGDLRGELFVAPQLSRLVADAPES
ncbi:hypothetical protein [Streptomyces hygroscopicus]|uniref:hypothetical protein n=1 Tax=Streptomyces hygroscopicus TaxID=1912 RepID=UPI001FCACFEB|nr:hypothetical protein [Streptomyces hygroscopicus]BDH11607.1 hypothetical protein HOK021_27860 [Streptomyces hygroscopicus]